MEIIPSVKKTIPQAKTLPSVIQGMECPRADARIALVAGLSGRSCISPEAQSGRDFREKTVPHRNAMGAIIKLLSID
jgi:hypothetical protein